jgi:hypothetical protein
MRRALLAAGAAGLSRWALAQPTSADPDQPIIETLEVAGAALELQFAPGFGAALRGEARAWVQRSALAVGDYFGRFPVPRAELLLVPLAGAGVGSGVSYGAPSPLVRVRLGRGTTPEQFLADWVMVHEMVHLAVPGVPRSQTWLHEGIATYVESVARTRAGLIAAGPMWLGLARAMPQGLPRDGDHGLDHTPTWGRTYWGGAMFCLLADVQIRKRSANRVGLQQALQGVLAGGGSYAVRWPLERIFEVADAAIGQATLTELHDLLKDCPAEVNLDALWQDLGVPLARGATTLRDDAPLAALRRAIAA